MIIYQNNRRTTRITKIYKKKRVKKTEKNYALFMYGGNGGMHNFLALDGIDVCLQLDVQLVTKFLTGKFKEIGASPKSSPMSK